MKNLVGRRINFAFGLRLMLLVGLFGLSNSLQAQSVLSGARTGTIQDMQRSDGFFIISSQNYGFDEELTRVYYDGEEVGPDFLNEGIVVRFVLNRDGLMVRIEVLGPIENIQALEPS